MNRVREIDETNLLAAFDADLRFLVELSYKPEIEFLENKIAQQKLSKK